jgi:dTDP-4-dehydrorhamnose reductase
MKVLITGAAGQIGFELSRALAHADVVALGRDALDLTRPREVERVVMDVRPDVLVNAAAYTAVDRAETEPDLAFAVNAAAPGTMAQCMRRLGGLLVHYSTDYVFDGRKADAYTEEDPTNPLSVYGASKLAGERAVIDSGGAHLVFRTAWIYDLRGRNFLNTMRRLASERPELRVVADQFGAPTWSRWVARATAQVLERCFEDGGARAPLDTGWSGVYHMTAAGRTSWHGFASAIVDQLAERGVTPRVPVTAIGTADYPTPAQRPGNAVLSNGKLTRIFGVQPVDWREQLRACTAEL